MSDKRAKPVEMFEEGYKILAEKKQKTEKGDREMTLDINKSNLEATIRKAGAKPYEFIEFKYVGTIDSIEIIKGCIDEKFSAKTISLSTVKAITSPTKIEPPKLQESPTDVFKTTAPIPIAPPEPASFDGLCKYCGGSMWDNREPNPEYPNPNYKPKYTCKDKACGGTYWTNPGSQKGPNWSKKS